MTTHLKLFALVWLALCVAVAIWGSPAQSASAAVMASIIRDFIEQTRGATERSP